MRNTDGIYSKAYIFAFRSNKVWGWVWTHHNPWVGVFCEKQPAAWLNIAQSGSRRSQLRHRTADWIRTVAELFWPQKQKEDCPQVVKSSARTHNSIGLDTLALGFPIHIRYRKVLGTIVLTFWNTFESVTLIFPRVLQTLTPNIYPHLPTCTPNIYTKFPLSIPTLLLLLLLLLFTVIEFSLDGSSSYTSNK